MKRERLYLSHGFPPVYDARSRILILGSFPSVKSREEQFYYGHPQNRFWRVLAALSGEELPETTEKKRAMLLRSGVALYDVIERCSIIGSDDRSIEDVTVTDLRPILRTAQIGDRIFANGAKAHTLYMKYTYPLTGIAATKLPSTSPANAACSLAQLTEIWSRTIGRI